MSRGLANRHSCFVISVRLGSADLRRGMPANPLFCRKEGALGKARLERLIATKLRLTPTLRPSRTADRGKCRPKSPQSAAKPRWKARARRPRRAVSPIEDSPWRKLSLPSLGETRLRGHPRRCRRQSQESQRRNWLASGCSRPARRRACRRWRAPCRCPVKKASDLLAVMVSACHDDYVVML
jgi:hypothetical protein